MQEPDLNRHVPEEDAQMADNAIVVARADVCAAMPEFLDIAWRCLAQSRHAGPTPSRK
jgi:oligoribonuclease (3'-5' exoribonuclease)